MSVGNKFIVFMLAQYVIAVLIFAVFDRNAGKALYYLGAAILTVGVLVMK